MDRTSSIPKSVLHYLLDKVRYSGLETYLNLILFSQIKRLMDEIELNSLFGSLMIHEFDVTIILEELVTLMGLYHILISAQPFLNSC